MKLAYLGPKGTFSELAATKYANSLTNNVETVEFGTIYEAIKSVANDSCDYAIVPVENSLEGAITVTLDSLIEFDLVIKDQLVLNITQNLFIQKGHKKEDISLIMSHPQPIAQSANYLHKNYLNVPVQYTQSTSEAAFIAQNSKETVAVIGGEMLSDIYNLELVDRQINDNDSNSTKFFVLSKNYSNKTGNDTTSIVFSAKDKPGYLFKVLSIFNILDVNMTKIESRPQKKKLGNYVFFVDLNGHIDDANVNEALELVKKHSPFYKFLGSYPK